MIKTFLFKILAVWEDLGSIITSDGTCIKDIESRLDKAGKCFAAFNKFMKDNKYATVEAKTKIYNCVILPPLCYACESWTTTQDLQNRIDVTRQASFRTELSLGHTKLERNSAHEPS